MPLAQIATSAVAPSFAESATLPHAMNMDAKALGFAKLRVAAMSDVKRYWFPQDEFRTDISYVESPAYAKLEAEAQALREEVAALSARVVVVPDRMTIPVESSGFVNGKLYGWNHCLDELARLNGKAVSEGLLRNVLNHHAAARAELEALLGEGKES